MITRGGWTGSRSCSVVNLDTLINSVGILGSMKERPYPVISQISTRSVAIGIMLNAIRQQSRGNVPPATYRYIMLSISFTRKLSTRHTDNDLSPFSCVWNLVCHCNLQIDHYFYPWASGVMSHRPLIGRPRSKISEHQNCYLASCQLFVAIVAIL